MAGCKSERKGGASLDNVREIRARWIIDLRIHGWHFPLHATHAQANNINIEQEKKKKKLKIYSLILYPLILESKVFHCYENGSTKNLMSLWLYKVYICTKGKVKWNGSVILRHSRPHSFSFLICALSSSVKSSARLSSALICSELFPMIRLATTFSIIVPSQCNVYWRPKNIRDIFSTPRIMAKVREAAFWNVLFPLTLTHHTRIPIKSMGGNSDNFCIFLNVF